MLKRLKFSYRYLTAPYRLRKWLNSQTVVVFVISMAFLAILAWTTPPQRAIDATQGSGSAAAASQELTPTPQIGPTRSATLTAEYLENANQTIGITLFGAALVLIVVVGVLVFLPKDELG